MPKSFFFFNFFLEIHVLIYWLIDWLLCWVFVSVRELSLVAASGDHSSTRCTGLSLSRPLSLRSTGSRRTGSVICGSRAQLLRGMRDPPRPGLEPVSPAPAGRPSTTTPPGKPLPKSFLKHMFLDSIQSLQVQNLLALCLIIYNFKMLFCLVCKPKPKSP